MNWINYQHFLHNDLSTQLYYDYLNSYEKVSAHFAGDYRQKEDWKKIIEVQQKKSINRSVLVRVLQEQNKEIHCGIKTLANIDLLYHENTFAVVTGQQLGLFTGPLYTIYKTITAIKLAEQLSKDFPEHNFVPIFWLEGEDHDFNEINTITLLNSANELIKLEYLLDGKPLEKNIGATGSVIIDGHMDSLFTSLDSTMQKSEYSAQLLELIKGYYKPGTSLLTAFSGLMNHLFEDTGIIFINANNSELKQLLKPVFTKEIQSVSHTSKLVIEKSAELEEQYHAQIKAKAVNLFLFHKNGRYLIEPTESDFFLKNTRQRFVKDELLAMIEQSPEVFSPNVVLRPICQDTLLPTVAYVGGPSEVAYFAQLKPVYEYFNVTMPIIYPRASITILEEKVKKIIEKYQIELPELFNDIEPLLAKISEQVSEVKIDTLFEALQTKIREAITEARFGIQQVDPTLSGTVNGTLSKFESHIHMLKEKAQKAQQQKQDVSLRQIQKAASNIFPNGNFQEREFNIIQFMNKYGPDFTKWLLTEIEIDRFQHQIIHI